MLTGYELLLPQNPGCLNVGKPDKIRWLTPFSDASKRVLFSSSTSWMSHWQSPCFHKAVPAVRPSCLRVCLPPTSVYKKTLYVAAVNVLETVYGNTATDVLQQPRFSYNLLHSRFLKLFTQQNPDVFCPVLKGVDVTCSSTLNWNNQISRFLFFSVLYVVFLIFTLSVQLTRSRERVVTVTDLRCSSADRCGRTNNGRWHEWEEKNVIHCLDLC